MCHAEDAQRAGFFLKESRLCGKGTGMRGLQGRTVCACARFPCGEPFRKGAAMVWAAGRQGSPRQRWEKGGLKENDFVSEEKIKYKFQK